MKLIKKVYADTALHRQLVDRAAAVAYDARVALLNDVTAALNSLLLDLEELRDPADDSPGSLSLVRSDVRYGRERIGSSLEALSFVSKSSIEANSVATDDERELRPVTVAIIDRLASCASAIREEAAAGELSVVDLSLLADELGAASRWIGAIVAASFGAGSVESSPALAEAVA